MMYSVGLSIDGIQLILLLCGGYAWRPGWWLDPYLGSSTDVLHLCSSRLYSRKNFLDWLDITSIAIKCKIFHRKWFFDAESSQTPHTFPFALLSSVDYSIQLCPHSKYEHLEGIAKVVKCAQSIFFSSHDFFQRAFLVSNKFQQIFQLFPASLTGACVKSKIGI